MAALDDQRRTEVERARYAPLAATRRWSVSGDSVVAWVVVAAVLCQERRTGLRAEVVQEVYSAAVVPVRQRRPVEVEMAAAWQERD